MKEFPPKKAQLFRIQKKQKRMQYVFVFIVYSLKKIDISVLQVLNSINFEFRQVLNVDQIEVRFLQGYDLPPLTCSQISVSPVFSPVLLTADHSGDSPLLPQLFLTSVSSLLLGMWTWDMQIFSMLFKNRKQKKFKNSHNNFTESLEDREDKI